MAPSSVLLAILSLVSYVHGHVVYPPDSQVLDSDGHVRLHASQLTNVCKLPAPLGGYLSEGHVPKGSRNSPSAPSVGTLKAKLIFVDFPDTPANDTTQTLYNDLVPGSQAWFKTSSYGRLKLSVDSDMTKFYRMPKASTAYTFNRFGAKQELYIKDALAVSALDFRAKKYDVLYIMPTRAAVEITFSPTKISPTTFAGGIIPNIVTFGQDLHLKYGFKLLNHETGHVIGLPDLYPSDSTGLPRGEWVGGFDIMGLINGTHPDYFAWHKWKLGWLNDEQIDCVAAAGSSKHSLAPVEIPGGVKAIVVKLSATSAFVVEVRSELAPQVVNNTACPLGMVVYTVNTLGTNSRVPPILVLNTHTNLPGCAIDRGGRLTTATVDFSRGEKSFKSVPYGINIAIDGVRNGTYDITVSWNGMVGSSSAAVPGSLSPSPWGGFPKGIGSAFGEDSEEDGNRKQTELNGPLTED